MSDNPYVNSFQQIKQIADQTAPWPTYTVSKGGEKKTERSGPNKSVRVQLEKRRFEVSTVIGFSTYKTS